MSERLMKASELALRLSVSKATLYRLVEQRRIPHIRIAGTVRFDAAQVFAWMKQQTIAVER
jgi:excisionase family DNA binding protein